MPNQFNTNDYMEVEKAITCMINQDFCLKMLEFEFAIAFIALCMAIVIAVIFGCYYIYEKLFKQAGEDDTAI